ncbi:Vps53-like, N-terminal [Ostreococcus tauri]|uniref:Vps53-like, N-terminal n=1 Tax=Ostreococcus tauri TaxID=70448 RepID=A0A096PAT7_OSTTA|nr:Vps53-like, N-terminal [Ostreococcus tauri]CEG02035.1 Vps53-like, N-terminal [Ostreococcus tauri]|eukprot:XP_003082011.2 Vps53-like, N-terminal [Ostreococcus tauri]
MSVARPSSAHRRTTSVGSSEALGRADFDPASFVNGVLPDEKSLSQVDGMIERLRERARLVDAEIAGALRAQSGSEARAREDFAVITHGVDALANRLAETEREAAKTEESVREICKDITRLDRAKNHLTGAITTLRRLSMFVSGMEQLELFALRRQYGDAANLLQAAAQLSTHFEAYCDASTAVTIARARTRETAARRARRRRATRQTRRAS